MSEELKAKLAALCSELDRADNPELTERLKPLITSIEQQLSAEGDGATSDEGSVVTLVDELVAEFEVDHPTLSRIFADISIKLSSMGI